MSDTTAQFVTLDNAQHAALFVETDNGIRVFYDLDVLFNTNAEIVMAGYADATDRGDHDRRLAHAGQTILLEGIRQSIEALRLEASFDRS